ncbi:MAG: Uncharacterised protein [Methanobacteriota archaeon]|nr:MAG: Uncharacterised protein [Euryarchaeota archaeon]
MPINHHNQRVQLAYANHCTSKAPCKHSLFSSYKITNSVIPLDEIKTLVYNDFEKNYNLDENGKLKSYFGHQLECKACKKFFVNAALNSKRTPSQHREDGLRRRAVEMLTRHLLEIELIYQKFRTQTNKEFDKEIWLKFNKRCFHCKIEILSTKEMHLDHTMPLAQLYPLDETATCLCGNCNNAKSDTFPVDFYSSKDLKKLSKLTGLPFKVISSRKPNQRVINLLRKNIIWFIETFLQRSEYTKERDGKIASNSILNSVNKAISKSATPFDILEEYEKQKNQNP